jgi:hypothetical protein
VQEKKRSEKSSKTNSDVKVSVSVSGKLHHALMKEHARRQADLPSGYKLTLSDVIRALLHERLDV